MFKILSISAFGIIYLLFKEYNFLFKDSILLILYFVLIFFKSYSLEYKLKKSPVKIDLILSSKISKMLSYDSPVFDLNSSSSDSNSLDSLDEISESEYSNESSEELLSDSGYLSDSESSEELLLDSEYLLDSDSSNDWLETDDISELSLLVLLFSSLGILVNTLLWSVV